MIGIRFGSLVVVGRSAHRDLQRKVYVLARCDCGVEKPVAASSLANGASSCGTEQHRRREALDVGENMIGKTFGMLTVTAALAERDNMRNRQVSVICECGEQRRRVRIKDLVRNAVVHCGGPAHRVLEPQPTVVRWRWSNVAMKTYAIEGVGTGRVKIGAARNIKDRLTKLQTASPVELRIIAASDANIEKALHFELADHCTHGEWFTMSDPVMKMISERMTPTSISVIDNTGFMRSRNRGKGSGSKGVRQSTCRACGQLGHYAKTCERRKTP
jgi:hypothetical protein